MPRLVLVRVLALAAASLTPGPAPTPPTPPPISRRSSTRPGSSSFARTRSSRPGRRLALRRPPALGGARRLRAARGVRSGRPWRASRHRPRRPLRGRPRQLRHVRAERRGRDRGARLPHLAHALERRRQLPQRLRAAARSLPFATTRDYDNYLARLRAFPAYGRQQIAEHAGRPAHRLHPAARDPRGIRGHDHRPPRGRRREERLLEALRLVPARRGRGGSRAPSRRRTRRDQKDVIPAYQAFLEFMTTEYIPKARTSVGGVGAARGARVLRLARASLHHPRRHARRGARHRPRGSRAHPGRDGRGPEAAPVGEGLPRVPAVPAHRPALLSRRPPRSC